MKDTFDRLAAIVIKEIRAQLQIAGHTMTGALSNSIEHQIVGSTIEIWLENYGIALDQGVPPERIPFTEPSGRGGRSLYIEGLQRFAQIKLGVTDQRESLGIAFAIARKQKLKGLPIAGPTEFLQKTINATAAEVATFVENWAEQIFITQIELLIQTIRK